MCKHCPQFGSGFSAFSLVNTLTAIWGLFIPTLRKVLRDIRGSHRFTENFGRVYIPCPQFEKITATSLAATHSLDLGYTRICVYPVHNSGYFSFISSRRRSTITLWGSIYGILTWTPRIHSDFWRTSPEYPIRNPGPLSYQFFEKIDTISLAATHSVQLTAYCYAAKCNNQREM